MKKYLFYSLVLIVFSACANEVFSVKRSNDWDGKPAKISEGVFQKKQSSRLISLTTFEVSPEYEYTLSGEFRLVNSTKTQPFFFGFIPYLANGTRIEQKHFRIFKNTSCAKVIENCKPDSYSIKVEKAMNYPANQPGIFIALNAKTDNSDIPNFDIIPVKNIDSSNGITTINLQTPLKKELKKGTLVRLQCLGADFIYSGCANKMLSDKWQTFSGSTKFDSKSNAWFPGTQKAGIVMLGGTADGLVEFRNIKVTSKYVGTPVIKHNETDLASRSNAAIISVSGSAKNDKFRAVSMYDGKDDTAFLSSPAMSKHDIDIHWFRTNVNINGISLDFTPVDYDYKESFGYLGHLAGIKPQSFKGTSIIPETLAIEVKQYGKWRKAGDFKVSGNKFFHRFPETLKDVQRLLIKFNTPDGKSIAIREIKLPGIPLQNVMQNIPGISKTAGHYLWHRTNGVIYPHDKPCIAYMRSKFTLKDKKIKEAFLTAAAYNKASFTLNGKKILPVVETPAAATIKAVRCKIPVNLLKKNNLLAVKAVKYDLLGGIYGVIFQIAVKYEDDTVEYIGSNSNNTKTSETAATGWDTELNGFNDWKAAHTRYGADPFPGNFWAVDCSLPFFDDEVELIDCRLTPAIPKDGEKYRMEFTFNIQKPLKNNYTITCRFGEMPSEIYGNFTLGNNMTSHFNSMFAGDHGKKTYVIEGVWCEEVSPTLPVRIAVSNGKQQAFIKSVIGKMTSMPIEGQLQLMLGKADYKLPHGFPDAKIKNERFYVNGKLDAPLFFSDNKLTAGRIADQLDNDALNIVRTGMWIPVIAGTNNRKTVHDNYIETIRQTANYTLRKNPSAKLFIVFELDPEHDWLFENPDEQIVLGDNSRLMGLYNNRGKGTIHVRGSMASQKYRKLVYDSLTELIKRIEKEPFANSVIGVSLAVGLAGENNYGVDRYDFTKGERSRNNALVGDWGVASRKACVRFLQKRYKNDAEWRKAWKISDRNAKITDFNSSEKWPNETLMHEMLWKARPKDRFIFRDRKVFGHMVEDLNEFQSLQRAEFILNAGKAVKEASNNRLIVGTYMGYIWPQLVNNPVGSSVYSGHAASRLVRQSPYIDFFSSPQWIHAVNMPIFYSVLIDSLKLFGKTYVVEGDIRTHYAAFGGIYDRDEMESQMRKICGFMLAKHLGAWFLGWSYSTVGAQGVRFFSDPMLLAELKNLRQQTLLPNIRDVKPGTRIAMLVSEQSAWYMDLLSPANTVHATFLYKNFHKFLTLGTGCDIYALEDLPELVKTGRLKDYKFVIFNNAFHLNKELRHLINTKVKADNRTVMFIYAPGYHDDDFNKTSSSVSVKGIADIIGADVKVIHEERKLGADWLNEKTPRECSIWWDVHQKALFTNEIGPIFYLPQQKGVETLATLRIDGQSHKDKIAACRIKKKDHTIIYSTLPELSYDALKKLVIESGTKLVNSQNDVIVNVGNGFLVVTNRGNAGELELELQDERCWTELPANKKIAEKSKKVKLFFKNKETKLFRID